MSWDRLMTVALVACALTTTGLVAYRTFVAPAAAPAPERKNVFVKNWKSQVGHGVQLGPANARVQLMEFADFECGFCASFHDTLKALRQRYPQDVALSFVHYPLPGHRFAEPGARAAECAAEQGRFEPMHDLLFEQQNQLGLKPWNEFASEAGVEDLPAFGECIKKTTPVARIETGRTLGKQLDVQGTPTLMINGWKLGYPPTAGELDKMVKAVLAGKTPVSDS